MQGVNVRYRAEAKTWWLTILLIMPVLLLVYESIARQYQHPSVLAALALLVQHQVSSEPVETMKTDSADQAPSDQGAASNAEHNQENATKHVLQPSSSDPCLEDAQEVITNCLEGEKRGGSEAPPVLASKAKRAIFAAPLDIKANFPLGRATTAQEKPTQEKPTQEEPTQEEINLALNTSPVVTQQAPATLEVATLPLKLAVQHEPVVGALGNNPNGQISLPDLEFSNLFDKVLISHLVSNKLAYLLCQDIALRWYVYQQTSDALFDDGRFVPFHGRSSINQHLSQRAVTILPDELRSQMRQIFAQQYHSQCALHLRLSQQLNRQLAQQQLQAQNSSEQPVIATRFDLQPAIGGDVQVHLQELIYQK